MNLYNLYPGDLVTLRPRTKQYYMPQECLALVLSTRPHKRDLAAPGYWAPLDAFEGVPVLPVAVRIPAPSSAPHPEFWKYTCVPTGWIVAVCNRRVPPGPLYGQARSQEMQLRLREGRGGYILKGPGGVRLPVLDDPRLYPHHLSFFPGLDAASLAPPPKPGITPGQVSRVPKDDEKPHPIHARRARSKFPHLHQPERQPVPDNPLYDPARADPNMPSFD